MFEKESWDNSRAPTRVLTSYCPSVNFFAPKITENDRFRVQKNGTLDARFQKQTPLFAGNYAQKW